VGGVRFVGRVDPSDPAAVKFAWSGTGLVATVTGTDISVKLRTEGTATCFFMPVIDGKMGTRFEVTQGSDQTVSLGTGLAAGDHTVELYRETEGMYGSSTFLGFVTGTVKGAPAASGKLLEVVGDSISAGYGNLGVEPHPGWVASPACHWTAANSSWYQTYEAIAGHELGAEVSTIAVSGWRLGGTQNLMPDVYENMLGSGDSTPWGFGPKANVVVINLGTNDSSGGFNAAEFTAAGIEFAKTIRSKYPDAWIFYTIGPMVGDPGLTAIKNAEAAIVTDRKNAGDTKIASFDFGTQNMGADGSIPTGCDWHPNVAEDTIMAGILKTKLKSALGW
jgi:lysophospholipase L1-like esterase